MQMRCAYEAKERAAPAAPAHLYSLTDAAGLDAAVRSKTLPAYDCRLGHDPSLVRYGVAVVEGFLAARLEACTDPLRTQFCRAALENFHPRGTHFDGFVVRLFDCEEAGTAPNCPGYALGVRAADLPLRLGQAIYAPTRQLAIVAAAYQACEDYFVSAVDRFGGRYRADLLTPCWDAFRHHTGMWLMRYRQPHLAAEREWIGVALAKPQQEADPVTFQIVGNRLLPAVRIHIGARTLETITIGATLPFETTCEALRAYLGRHGMHGIAIAGSARRGGGGAAEIA